MAHGELKLCSSESLDVVQQVVDTWESCWSISSFKAVMYDMMKKCMYVCIIHYDEKRRAW